MWDARAALRQLVERPRREELSRSLTRLAVPVGPQPTYRQRQLVECGRRATGRRTTRSSSESPPRAQAARRHRSGQSRRDQTPPVGCASWPPARSPLNTRSRTRYASSSTAASAGPTSATLSACRDKELASAINDASRSRPLPRMSRIESRRSSLESCSMSRRGPATRFASVSAPARSCRRQAGRCHRQALLYGVGASGIQDSLHGPLVSGCSPAHSRA